ncbi:MAG: hypothetical protein JRI68_28470, partial [Deltaproteobacteria bacterium]|nr:hypothetical protein [Deltaproteobacteria bacterium]
LVAVPSALLALTHCKGDDETAVVDAGPTPPAMSHGPPNEAAGQMCVVCHSCGNDGTSPVPAPIIDNSNHDPCTFCHEPDGSVVFHGDAACEWEMDCVAVPPVVNCVDCHTVAWVNDLCEECHLGQ